MRRRVDAVVDFAYEAEQEDELSLKIGDIIKNVIQSDGGWWEGELNGKKGMFPENFVKVLKQDDKGKSPGIGKKEAPERKSVRELASKFKDNMPLGPLPPKKKDKKKKCKVMFDYTPENEDELLLKEGEIIDFIREVEDGWWEGSNNGPSGVFPSNFVEMCEEQPEDAGQPDVPDKPSGIGSGDESSGSVHEIKGKKVIGIGLGNIFQGGPIKLRSAPKNKEAPPVEAKKHADVKEPPKPPPHEPARPPPLEPVRPPLPEPTKAPVADPIPITTEVVKREKKVNRAVVRFSYTAEQPDELSLKEGETISVLDTKLEDEGWWKGEVNGKVGVFPDNFVELIPEEAPKPKKPPPPSISTIPKAPPGGGGGAGKPGLYPKLPDRVPAADPHLTESKKHDTKHDGKHKPEAPSNKIKDHTAHLKGPPPPKPTQSTNDRVAPPSTAAKKPFVPPPVGKKPPPPKPDPPKPTEPAKLESKPVSVTATIDSRTKDAREGNELADDKEPPGQSDQENNFESLEPTSQKLTHLTASRAKGPKKRPPSTIFNLGENPDSPDSEELPSSSTPQAVHTQHNDSRAPHTSKEKQSSISDVEKRSTSHSHNQSNHQPHHTAPPRPPEPSATSGQAGGAAVSKILEEVQRELRDLRTNTVSRSTYLEMRADYDRLKQEVESFKSSSTKKIRELMMEVDEEKKLRLNTQVEIERIKKLLAETNV
ncbi:SH3 domain-containing kinase-binding protein 1-like isoform X4 [Haliotis rufescens]|uniref:SH3 domain-containing kinase-binding protein 1-like isoform X4 n=1 Tax=Haliotis rufescens TaxID=6454 RepID=UPI00201F0E4B|nr:SH3 domain-containing kinase-binding protein 1-like isoform X4 [Haliotis rufescens]